MLGGKINSYLFLRESTDLSNAAIKQACRLSPELTPCEGKESPRKTGVKRGTLVRAD